MKRPAGALGVCGLIGLVLALALGSPASSAAASSGWLDLINTYRAASGLSLVTEQPAWTAGLSAHLRYLALTPPGLITGPYASAHTENPASPYYTPEGASEAAASNLSYGDADDLAAINGWLAAPFHAIGMLRPALQQVAFARDEVNRLAGLDVLHGLGATPSSTTPVLFPGPGMTTDLLAYSGGESPSPLETCHYATAGLPLIALLTQDPSPSTRATLTGPTGTVSSSSPGLCVITRYNFVSSDTVYGPTGQTILQEDHAILIIPQAPLTGGSQYTVRITQDGSDDITWSFNTGSTKVLNAPTGVSATAGNGQATVGFSAPAANGAPITSYTVTATPGGAQASGAASPITITGLLNGTTYTFTVTANNSVGAGPASAQSNAVTPAAAAPPPTSGSGGGGGGGGSTGGGGGGGGASDLGVTVKADAATANVGDTVVFRIVVTDKNNAPAPALHLRVALPANASSVQSYADRGPGCSSTSATTLDCNLDYLSSDSPVGNVILWLKLTTAGAMPVTATATYQQADPTPADNTGTFTVNQTPAAPPVVVPPVVVPPTVFCLVPKVSGLGLVQALVKLRLAHCGNSTVKLHLKSVKLGKIGAQLPKPGAKLAANAKVKLTVSLGPAKKKPAKPKAR